jgi:serine/threonine protein kinase
MRKDIANQLVTGVQFLHNNHIMHRDIKPGNIVFVDDTLKEHEVSVTTKEYRAPELLLRGDQMFSTTFYGPEVDIWAVGVVLLELELGSYPFDSDVGLLETITSVFPVPNYGIWQAFRINDDNILDQVV